MLRWGWLLALLVFLGMAAEGSAQIITPPFPAVLPGVPILVPNGIGFRYRGSHLTVAGFVSSGVPVVPAVPLGGQFFGPVGPPVFVPPLINGVALPGSFAIPTYGSVDSRTSVNIIVPTIVQGARNPLELGGGVNRDVDLSGVDLDVVGPEALQPGGRPAQARGPGPAKNKPANKVEVARQEPAPVPEKVKPQPIPPKAEVAKLQPQPAKPAVPPAKLDAPEKAQPEKKEPLAENQQLIDLGLTAFRAREYGLAAHRFRQAVDAEPALGRGYFLLAQANLALGKYKDAVSAIENGMKRQEDWPLSAFQPRQDLYKGLEEDWAVHKKQLEVVQAKEPKQPAYLFLQAYQLWFDGQRDRAAELLRQARPQVGNPAFIDSFLKLAAK